MECLHILGHGNLFFVIGPSHKICLYGTEKGRNPRQDVCDWGILKNCLLLIQYFLTLSISCC